MGAWGYKALESDEGLDVVGFLQDFINQQNDSKQLIVRNSIQAMKNQGFFGETFEDIDFFYDMSAMALAEFYIHYLNTGQFYGNDSNDANIHMTADKSSLTFILRYLKDIETMFLTNMAVESLLNYGLNPKVGLNGKPTLPTLLREWNKKLAI